VNPQFIPGKRHFITDDGIAIISQMKFSCENVHLRKKGLHSRGTHRADPCKVLKSRYTPSILTDYIVKGNPLNNPDAKKQYQIKKKRAASPVLHPNEVRTWLHAR